MSVSSREKILQNIRKALAVPVPLPFPGQEPNGEVYPKPEDDLSVLFAREFSRLLGRFAYCSDQADLQRQVKTLVQDQGWKKIYCADAGLRNSLGGIGSEDTDLAGCDVSLTTCEALVARTGTMVLSAALAEGRTSSVYAPVHVCIARTSQLVWDLSDALRGLQEKYPEGIPSLVSFATGPSRTADIEKTLVVGVHGPKEVYCFLVEDQVADH